MAADDEELSEAERLMANMEKLEASDLHIKVGSAPIYRIHGKPQRLKGEPLMPARTRELIFPLLAEDKRKLLEETGAVDIGVGIRGTGRFRVNIYKQRGTYSLAARRVNSEIPTFEELMLPKAVNRIPAFEDGLVLVIGVTGSGKSTTLAAIIDRINHSRRVHVMTIEDPIEYVYRDDKAFINQREIGIDAPDFHVALKYALRQDPDVILVGEMRDVDTVETALAAAETGHLVLGTLHATNVMQTVTRMLEFFPPERQPGIRQVISYTLRAVVGQRLVPGIKKEHPRVPAVELMFVTPSFRKYISDGDDPKIPEAIRQAAKEGMQDFNMSLLKLVQEEYIAEEDALARSPAPEALRMNLRGITFSTDNT